VGFNTYSKMIARYGFRICDASAEIARAASFRPWARQPLPETRYVSYLLARL